MPTARPPRRSLLRDPISFPSEHIYHLRVSSQLIYKYPGSCQRRQRGCSTHSTHGGQHTFLHQTYSTPACWMDGGDRWGMGVRTVDRGKMEDGWGMDGW